MGWEEVSWLEGDWVIRDVRRVFEVAFMNGLAGDASIGMDGEAAKVTRLRWVGAREDDWEGVGVRRRFEGVGV